MKQLTKEQFIKWYNLSYYKDDIPDTLYHYTSYSILEYILKDYAPVFKLTNIDDFSDKLEGRCYEAFYDLALDELLVENVIGDETRTFLQQIDFSKEGYHFDSENSDKMLFISCEFSFSTYVGLIHRTRMLL